MLTPKPDTAPLSTEGAAPEPTAPDVSVVVPVYNTMPHLRRCLASLATQSIGRDRMEIIAVDDGSTDGGGRLLDRFAARYPGAVQVIHQPNSGGPAAPCNRALDVATGRYVFFVGADDYLGRQALERLVAVGDRYGSDVVAGRVVGVNSRFVHQEIFARDEAEIGLADSALAWSLTNVKLFRRELIERHGLRYPEDMPLGSDLPFTLEACLRAGRVSVLATYDCYYAVRRLNNHNITHLSGAEDRLHCLRRLVEFTVGLIEPGKERDAVLARLFGHEVTVLLRDDLPQLDHPTRRKVYEEIRDIAARHLNDEVAARMDIETWLRVSVLRHGGLDDLLAMLGQDTEHGVPDTVVEGGRWFAAYPGFRARRPITPTPALPDEALDVTARLPDWLAKLDATEVAWDRDRTGSPVLALTVRSPLPDLSSLCAGPVRVDAGELSTPAVVVDTAVSTTLRAEFPVARVLAASDATGQRRAFRVSLVSGGRAGSAPLRAPGVRLPRPVLARRGRRLYALAATRDQSGRLTISVVPVTAGRLLAKLGRVVPVPGVIRRRSG